MPTGARKIGSDTWFSFALIYALSGPTFAFAADEEDPPLVTDPVYAAPNRLVEVEPGRRLNLYCLGSGSPTVVFDSGLGGGTTAWSPVQKQIAGKTRACSYDRAGRNFSDPGTRPSTSANIVDDLHRLLVAAGEKPPFVLVGHSLGGLNMRLFADTYRDEVAGMVLVDPMHEDQSEKYRALDPAKASREEWARQREPAYVRQRACRDAAAGPGFPEGSGIRKECHIGEVDGLYGPEINAAYEKLEVKPGWWQGFLSENENAFTASSDQVRASRRSYGDMPLIVLTRAPAPKKKDETQEVRDVRNQVWVQMHDDIASLSTRGVNRVIPDSTHAIQFDQPAAVIDAVLEVAGKK
jgi:pimeloyl-ACP methyl ester carboxylesterase